MHPETLYTYTFRKLSARIAIAPAFVLALLTTAACMPNEVPCASIDPSCGNGFLLYVTETEGPRADLNGDRFEDLLVAAQDANAGGTQRGQLSIFFGPLSAGDPIPSTSANVLISGVEDNVRFSVIQSVADFNNDGRHDLAIGVQMAAAGGTQRGSVYVFFGRSEWPATMLASDADAVISHSTDSAMLGGGLTAGDWNADGIQDLLIGAGGAAGSAPGLTGVAYGFYGGSDFPAGAVTESAADFRIEGALDGSFFGARMISADANRDGVDDAIVSAFREDNGAASDAGAVRIFHGPFPAGSVRAANEAAFTVRANTANLFFGAFISADDGNGDGELDLMATAGNAAGGGTARGEISMMYGPLSGSIARTQADLTLQGAADNDSFGGFGLITDDVSGDGLPDLFGAAPGAAAGGAQRGKIHGISLAASPTGTLLAQDQAFVTIEGAVDAEQLQAVLPRQDLNGDGVLGEFLFGAPNAPAGGTQRGTAGVIFTNAQTRLQGTVSRTIADLAIQGAEDNARLGIWVRE